MCKQMLQCIQTRRYQLPHFLNCNQMFRALANWAVRPAKWPTSMVPLSQLHSTLVVFNLKSNPGFFVFIYLFLNKGIWVLLYLTWRVESTLRGPELVVPVLFPCGATGPFNTRQFQCGLIRKLGSSMHHGDNDGPYQSLPCNSEILHLKAGSHHPTLKTRHQMP